MGYFWTKTFVAAALISCVSSIALAGGWTVVKTSSGVQYTTDKKNWITVKSGMALPENAWINTGKRGRLTIQKETNVVNVNPGTLAGIIGLGGKLDKTIIAQQTGSVTLDLVRKSAPWMTVQTPFLAAVVKGTKFTVAVGRNEATVDVARGRVGVTDPRRGESVDIVSGQRARVDGSSRRSMEVKGAGKIEPIKTVKPSETVVPMTPEQAKEVEVERKSASLESTTPTDNNQQNANANQNGNDNNNGNGNDNANANTRNDDDERSGSKVYDDFRKDLSERQRAELERAAKALEEFDIKSEKDVNLAALKDLNEDDIKELKADALQALSGDAMQGLNASQAKNSSDETLDKLKSLKSEKLKKLLEDNPKLARWWKYIKKKKDDREDD